MISIPENEIDSDKFYAIQGTHIKKLFDLKKRLYSEKRMNADEMRDRAHLIGLLFDDFTEVPELLTVVLVVRGREGTCSPLFF